MNDIIKIEANNGKETVDARTLHMALEVGKDFSNWIKDRIEKYGFQDGKDFETCSPDLASEIHGGHNRKDYRLTVAMAKELAMVENSDKGREVRQYLIQVEEAWNSPDMVILRGLQMAEKKIANFQHQIQLMKPKADFYDAVTGSSDTVDLGTVAKLLKFEGIGRNTLFEILRNEGYLMPNNYPYQKYVDSGHFRVIETSYQKPDGSTHVSFKTVVYQKGVSMIRKVLERKVAS